LTQFSKLALKSEIVDALNNVGITIPTPIQNEAIPIALEGRDILGSAHTGTGKTLAFLLPTIQALLETPEEKGYPRVLILVPTRELAEQVSKEAMSLCSALGNLKTVCVYGGMPYPKQCRQLSKKYDILVATPGRLIDHIDRRRINLSHVQTLILDEADRMLDMGFIQPVEEITAQTPSTRQTLMFTATLTKSVKKISEKLQKDPFHIAIDAGKRDNTLIDTRLFFVDDKVHKIKILENLLKNEAVNKAIIFTSTKIGTEDLAKDLEEKGYKTAPLHGDYPQRQRERVLRSFKDDKIQILVATDVASRGIDIPTITHVFNFDLPQNPEDFVHRIGRTGRAGAKGTAITLIRRGEAHVLSELETLTGKKMNAETLPGLEPRQKGAFPGKGPGKFSGRSRGKRPGGESSFKRRGPSTSRGFRASGEGRDTKESSSPRKSYKPRDFGAPAERSDRRESRESGRSHKARDFGAPSEASDTRRPSSSRESHKTRDFSPSREPRNSRSPSDSREAGGRRGPKPFQSEKKTPFFQRRKKAGSINNQKKIFKPLLSS